MWYLESGVSFPDLCHLSYLYTSSVKLELGIQHIYISWVTFKLCKIRIGHPIIPIFIARLTF